MQNPTNNLPSNLHSYNPRFCPNPYCVCTQPTTATISGIITTNSIVNVYAATSGAYVCPTAGAAVSEAGCQIVVESKTDSTCGPVVFNTDFCLASSTTLTSPSSTSTQLPGALQAQVTQIVTPTSAPASTPSTPASTPASTIASTPASTPATTQGPSYTIVYVKQPRTLSK